MNLYFYEFRNKNLKNHELIIRVEAPQEIRAVGAVLLIPIYPLRMETTHVIATDTVRAIRGPLIAGMPNILCEKQAGVENKTSI